MHIMFVSMELTTKTASYVCLQCKWEISKHYATLIRFMQRFHNNASKVAHSVVMAGIRHGVSSGEKSISLMEWKQGAGVRWMSYVPHPKNLYRLHSGRGQPSPTLVLWRGKYKNRRHVESQVNGLVTPEVDKIYIEEWLHWGTVILLLLF
jgi:hypothetical protein